ncbi:hypothetical protein FQZ97_647720 [compost metagenome]
MGFFSGPAISIVWFSGFPIAASATKPATSSAAMGWNAPNETRTVPSTVASSAMPPRNSRNCVDLTMVYGTPPFLIRFSCATFAGK